MSVILCQCGCGRPAAIATKTSTAKGHIKGHPTQYAQGHSAIKPLPEMSHSDRAWLAGLLEGEGCFGVYGRKRAARGREPWIELFPTIRLRMTDEDIVARVAYFFSAPYTRCPSDKIRPGFPCSKKDRFDTELTGHRALTLMRKLRPWMGRRRGTRIDEILEKLPPA